jgi:hypothetical protein
MAALGAADVGQDHPAVDDPGQALEAVVHLVAGVDAFARLFDIHLAVAEKADAPAADVGPGLVGEQRQIFLGGVMLARGHGEEFTHKLAPVLPN